MFKTWLSLSHFSVVEKLRKKKFGLLIFYRIIIPSFNTIWFQEGGINIAGIQSIGFFVKKFKILKSWLYFATVISSIIIRSVKIGECHFIFSVRYMYISISECMGIHVFMTIQLNIPCVQICQTYKIQFEDFAPAHRSTSYTFQHYEYELQIKKLLLTNLFCLSRAPRTWTRMWLYENND